MKKLSPMSRAFHNLLAGLAGVCVICLIYLNHRTRGVEIVS